VRSYSRECDHECPGSAAYLLESFVMMTTFEESTQRKRERMSEREIEKEKLF
jgi:hypothetical protein